MKLGAAPCAPLTDDLQRKHSGNLQTEQAGQSYHDGCHIHNAATIADWPKPAQMQNN